MSASYLLRRTGVFLLIAWLAATLNFFLPRLTGQDPVRVKLLQQAQLGGYVQAGIDEMVKEYDRRFGLDRPLWAQYLSLPARRRPARLQLLHRQLPPDGERDDRGGAPLDRRRSSAPRRSCRSPSARSSARCWRWPRAPRWMRWLMPPLWALHAIPFFLLGLILIYLFAFRIPVLPMFGGYSAGAFPAFTRTVRPATCSGTRSCRRCRSSWWPRAGGPCRCAA